MRKSKRRAKKVLRVICKILKVIGIIALIAVLVFLVVSAISNSKKAKKYDSLQIASTQEMDELIETKKKLEEAEAKIKALENELKQKETLMKQQETKTIGTDYLSLTFPTDGHYYVDAYQQVQFYDDPKCTQKVDVHRFMSSALDEATAENGLSIFCLLAEDGTVVYCTEAPLLVTEEQYAEWYGVN